MSMFLEYEKTSAELAKIISGFIIKLATDTTIDHRNYAMGEKQSSRLYEIFKTTGSIDKSIDYLVNSFLDDNAFVDDRQKIILGEYGEDEESFLDDFANSVFQYFGLYEILSLNEDDADYFKKIIIEFFQKKFNDEENKDIEPTSCHLCGDDFGIKKIIGNNGKFYCSDDCMDCDDTFPNEDDEDDEDGEIDTY
jgi:hypothetical protein